MSYATLTRVDPRANEERLTVRITPPNPLGAAEEPVLAAGEGALWVGNRDFVRMYRLNPQSLDIVALVEGVNPFALAVGAGAVWAAEQDDQTVTRIELATNAVRLSIRYGVRQPGSVAFGAGAVWVTDTAEDRVWKIDATKNSVAGTIVVGDGPEFVAVTPRAVWVANRFGKSISRIDPRTDTVVATIELGREPRGLAAAGDSIWVTVS